VVYASEESYFNDLKKIDKIVYDQIGIHTKIIRFPGGASNAVSKKYSPGIMKKLTRSVLREGYVFFDWNAANNDATGQPIDKAGMLAAVKESAKNKNCVCVLMHDTKVKNTTVEALPDIIDYFKNEGYEFDILTDKMPYLCQPLNN
jgi:peptidoglycan/xylan/chitin deacetylase (PgdA/CDA1 family)